MYIIITILSILLVVSLYIIRNLLLKNEKQEDILTSYMVYLNKISKIIEVSDKKMKEVDSKGTFKSDDEVGFFFEQIKSVQDILNTFIIKEIDK
jgi:chemotaxis protein histidine kinase CheA